MGKAWGHTCGPEAVNEKTTNGLEEIPALLRAQTDLLRERLDGLEAALTRLESDDRETTHVEPPAEQGRAKE